VALRARWVTPRARWVTAKSSLGDAKSSLGDAESSLGDAKSWLGDAKSSLGDVKSSLGDVKSSLGGAKSPWSRPLHQTRGLLQRGLNRWADRSTAPGRTQAADQRGLGSLERLPPLSSLPCSVAYLDFA
jgi:hypothetical protein